MKEASNSSTKKEKQSMAGVDIASETTIIVLWIFSEVDGLIRK